MTETPAIHDQAAADAGMRARRRKFWRNNQGPLLAVLSISLSLVFWQVASTFWFDPFLVPPPSVVARAAWPMIQSGEIFNDVWISMTRVLVGFISGSAVAIVVGVLIGRIKVLHHLLDPVIELLRYLSPTAMIPIAVIWFGIGEMSKYFLIFWGTLFIVLVNTVAGVWRTPIARQRAAECMGVNRFEIFFLIVIPSATPYIVTGMRVAMASSFMSIIPAEILAADSGIGYLLQKSSMLLQTDKIFVALITICVLGFMTDRVFRLLVDKTLSRFTSSTSI
ncbi:ABC transporter permease [Ancylobacter sp. MQZ15Z-1]|uniref:ABC transporter permease n=1 Tax=Ancylobacter mangrovi TaxID=2972472 RepID=A0A9X2T6A9_9HYPH|nr:ABC transporter permease [Ancylobacter mangrovi]MCS0494738.1 ABC transporter permease [Ancylobacter mangrovi]